MARRKCGKEMPEKRASADQVMLQILSFWAPSCLTGKVHTVMKVCNLSLSLSTEWYSAVV